jgi:hypothetical protein
MSRLQGLVLGRHFADIWSRLVNMLKGVWRNYRKSIGSETDSWKPGCTVVTDLEATGGEVSDTYLCVEDDLDSE